MRDQIQLSKSELVESNLDSTLRKLSNDAFDFMKEHKVELIGTVVITGVAAGVAGVRTLSRMANEAGTGTRGISYGALPKFERETSKLAAWTDGLAQPKPSIPNRENAFFTGTDAFGTGKMLRPDVTQHEMGHYIQDTAPRITDPVHRAALEDWLVDLRARIASGEVQVPSTMPTLR